MTPEQIVAHYFPLLIAYSVIVGLFLKNRRDVKRLRQEAQDAAEDADQSGRSSARGISNLSLEVQAIRQSVRQIEECPAGVTSVQGLNLTKRAQVLRMYRRGETVSSIAAALRTPSNEVQLVLKVHHLLQSEQQA